MIRWIAIICLLSLAVQPAEAAGQRDTRWNVTQPTAEFGIPYSLKLQPAGDVIELSGSFSWAVPQSLTAILSQAPAVRTIWLDSPGGHLQAAEQVARIIQARKLDTYVPRSCASACTIAFLGGKRRIISPRAKLGFHEAQAPGYQPAIADLVLKRLYLAHDVPLDFIAHVLVTPPTALWFPSTDELRAAGVITGDPRVLVPTEVEPPDTVQSLTVTSDGALLQFAMTLTQVLQDLRVKEPELCWQIVHRPFLVVENALGPETQAALLASWRRVKNEATTPLPIEPEEAHRAEIALEREIGVADPSTTEAALRGDMGHAAFCPALGTSLSAALRLPAPYRIQSLRALLPPKN